MAVRGDYRLITDMIAPVRVDSCRCKNVDLSLALSRFRKKVRKSRKELEDSRERDWVVVPATTNSYLEMQSWYNLHIESNT